MLTKQARPDISSNHSKNPKTSPIILIDDLQVLFRQFQRQSPERPKIQDVVFIIPNNSISGLVIDRSPVSKVGAFYQDYSYWHASKAGPKVSPAN